MLRNQEEQTFLPHQLRELGLLLHLLPKLCRQRFLPREGTILLPSQVHSIILPNSHNILNKMKMMTKMTMLRKNLLKELFNLPQEPLHSPHQELLPKCQAKKQCLLHLLVQIKLKQSKALHQKQIMLTRTLDIPNHHPLQIEDVCSRLLLLVGVGHLLPVDDSI